MKLKVMLDKGAFAPEKAHPEDAGFDLRTPESVRIGAHRSKKIFTGVHVEIPRGYVGMIKSKSGLNVKYGIVCEGVIDCGYTGQIIVKAYNNSNEEYTFACGDKITQLVIMPIADIDEVEIVESISGGERGNAGFGSTGR